MVDDNFIYLLVHCHVSPAMLINTNDAMLLYILTIADCIAVCQLDCETLFETHLQHLLLQRIFRRYVLSQKSFSFF